MDSQINRNKLFIAEVNDIDLPWSPTSGSVTPQHEPAPTN
jgi:hypothetical protein